MNLSGQKVFVTGADGFIGSHLSEMLVRRGARVRAMTMYNSFNSWGWLEDTDCLGDIEVVAGDIRDHHFLTNALQGVDVVIHLAALIAIPHSYAAPDSYVQTNVTGTLNVARAALASGAKRVVHTSTSEVYGTARRVPIDEEHPLQPQSPYSASKIGADAVAMSFFHAYGLPVTIARPFNTYGPRQSARAVIPTIITQMLAQQKEIRLGSLAPLRDFTYVEDTCRGILALAECEAAVGQTVNIGSDSEISIGGILELIQEIVGRRIEVSRDAARVRPERSEVDRLRCDNGKIRELAGFQPQISLRIGLQRTVDWFRNSGKLGSYKAGIFNV